MKARHRRLAAALPEPVLPRVADLGCGEGATLAEAGRELGEVGGEAAVGAVGVAGEAIGQDCVDFVEDGFVVFLEDGVLRLVGGVVHWGSIAGVWLLTPLNPTAGLNGARGSFYSHPSRAWMGHPQIHLRRTTLPIGGRMASRDAGGFLLAGDGVGEWVMAGVGCGGRFSLWILCVLG